MSRAKMAWLILAMIMFLDVDFTAIIFGGRVVSLIALGVLMVAVAVAVWMIIRGAW